MQTLTDIDRGSRLWKQLAEREKDVGAMSPLLANLFLQYAFDRSLATNYPQVVFERFADDVIVHCRTEREALAMRKAIAERLQNCGLELHPEKTKIVYCKDDDRRRTYLHEKFDFLGYTFRARSSMTRKGSTSPTSVRQFLRKRHRPFEQKFVAGNCNNAATRRSRICLGCSILSFEVGSSTRGGIIARRSIRRCANWVVN
jgi:hypothetical protein